MKSIRLNNRHSKSVRLDYVRENGGYLQYKGNDCFQWKYCSIHSSDNGNIIAIDPEGGPLLSIGDKFNGLVIDHFDKDLNVYMKKKTSYKIAAMSDLHGYLPEQLEPCDIVCICGDFVPLEIQRNYTDTFNWLKEKFFPWVDKLPCEKVFLIGGNHDFFLEQLTTSAINKIAKENFLFEKFVYLNNTLFEYDGIRVYGCPNVENLKNWAFYTDSPEIIYANIPQCDILLTHTPPDIQDLGRVGNTSYNYGSKELAKILDSKVIKYWFCGHVHDGNHNKVEYNGCEIHNVSLKDDNYYPIYPVTYVNLEV